MIGKAHRFVGGREGSVVFAHATRSEANGVSIPITRCFVAQSDNPPNATLSYQQQSREPKPQPRPDAVSSAMHLLYLRNRPTRDNDGLILSGPGIIPFIETHNSCEQLTR